MMTRTAMATTGLLALAALGCTRPAQDAGATTTVAATMATADTLRGIVRVVGAAPATAVVLSGPSGDAVSVGGRAAAALRRLTGLEVVVTGRRTGARDPMAGPRGLPVFEADRFAVRASDGIAAHDGVLLRQRDRWELLLDDGRRVPIAALPPSLASRVGKRVWLAGSLEGTPVSYGIIE